MVFFPVISLIFYIVPFIFRAVYHAPTMRLRVLFIFFYFLPQKLR